jgi:hypothetical protein
MENAHLLRYPRPSSLQRTSEYASFLGISDALHLCIFHQPPKPRFKTLCRAYFSPVLAGQNGQTKRAMGF